MLRKLFNRLVLALLPLTLMACATVPGGPSARTVYAETLVSYTAAMHAATALRTAGKLSPQQVGDILTMDTVLVPIIKGPTPTNPAQAIALLNRAIAELVAIKQHPGA